MVISIKYKIKKYKKFDKKNLKLIRVISLRYRNKKFFAIYAQRKKTRKKIEN